LQGYHAPGALFVREPIENGDIGQLPTVGGLEGADFDAMFHVTPASVEFGRIVGRDGMRSALRWRDQPFGES
jgi:hypothetical protein